MLPTSQNQRNYFPHFTDKESEVQKLRDLPWVTQLATRTPNPGQFLSQNVAVHKELIPW